MYQKIFGTSLHLYHAYSKDKIIYDLIKNNKDTFTENHNR